MSSEWRRLTVAAIQADSPRAIAIGPFGSRMKAEMYVPSGVPVIRGNNISDTRMFTDDFVHVSATTADQLSGCNVFAGDLVFPHRGAIGEVGIVPQEGPDRFMISTSLMKLTCNPKLVEPTFVFYYFRSSIGRASLLERASTVGTPGIGQPLASLRSITIPVPPLDEQRAIAHTLGTLDDKIELNRRMTETLDTMARALFKAWFVGFAARDAQSLPGSFEDSELGAIPKGWRSGTLSDFSSLNPESWSQATRPNVIQYVDLAGTKWGRIGSVASLAAADAPSRAQRVLRPLDTIVGTVRPGNGSFAFISEDGLTGSTGFAVLRPSKPEYAEFVYLAATAPENIDALAHLADGGAYPAVRPDVVAATPIVVPPDKVLKAFSEVVQPLLARSACNERESRTLAALRDTLLPKLISGELRVKDAGRFVRRIF